MPLAAVYLYLQEQKTKHIMQQMYYVDLTNWVEIVQKNNKFR